MKEPVMEVIRKGRIIAIVRGVYGEPAVALAEALWKGGVGVMEITFDQRSEELRKQTVDTIRRIALLPGGKMIVGAGTVTTVDMVEKTCEAGGRLIVSPDTNADVIRRTGELDMVSIPGAFSATEVLTAYRAGADFVKIFPAAQLGPEYIRALRSPLPQIPMLAVGGVDESNLPSFLAAGCAGAGVGGNLVNREWIAAGAFDRITELAKRYCAVAAQG